MIEYLNELLMQLFWWFDRKEAPLYWGDCHSYLAEENKR